MRAMRAMRAMRPMRAMRAMRAMGTMGTMGTMGLGLGLGGGFVGPTALDWARMPPPRYSLWSNGAMELWNHEAMVRKQQRDGGMSHSIALGPQNRGAARA